MNGFKKCENGHFFKEDLSACPYCPSSKGASNNASASNDLNKTMVAGANSGGSNNDAVKTDVFGSQNSSSDQTKVFGAGAGNAPLELILPVFEKSGYELGIDFQKVIIEADKVMNYLVPSTPVSTPVNVLTGLNRLFSGFEKPIIKASKLYGIEYSSLIFELGNRKLVAGQEDLILEVAQKLKK
jgi:hypothetical protein